MYDSTKIIISTISWFFIAVILIALLLIAAFRTEIHECKTWRKQAKTFPSYYITQWQKDQCDYHNINIDAPVVTPQVVE